MARKTARAAAMQLIFEQLAGGQGGEETLQMVYEALRQEEASQVEAGEPGVKDRAWIQGVLEGVLAHLDELDDEISAASRNWTIERMNKVDLTILRLAAWEILFENDKDVPGTIAISEALELAEKYSDPASVRFVNGVLGTILRKKEAAE